MKKKVLAIVLILALAVCMCACSKGNDTKESAGDANVTEGAANESATTDKTDTPAVDDNGKAEEPATVTDVPAENNGGDTEPAGTNTGEGGSGVAIDTTIPTLDAMELKAEWKEDQVFENDESTQAEHDAFYGSK